jgi:hypothetical protein
LSGVEEQVTCQVLTTKKVGLPRPEWGVWVKHPLELRSNS